MARVLLHFFPGSQGIDHIILTIMYECEKVVKLRETTIMWGYTFEKIMIKLASEAYLIEPSFRLLLFPQRISSSFFFHDLHLFPHVVFFSSANSGLQLNRTQPFGKQYILSPKMTTY